MSRPKLILKPGDIHHGRKVVAVAGREDGEAEVTVECGACHRPSTITLRAARVARPHCRHCRAMKTPETMALLPGGELVGLRALQRRYRRVILVVTEIREGELRNK